MRDHTHLPYGDEDIGYLQHEDKEQSQSNEQQEESQSGPAVTITQSITSCAVACKDVSVRGVGSSGEQSVSYTTASLKGSFLCVCVCLKGIAGVLC